MSASAAVLRSGVDRLARWKWAVLYFALVVASQVFVATREPEPPPDAAGAERVTLGSGAQALSALRWQPKVPAPHALPVVLLHGSPGDASNFHALGERLAESGREVLALDLPGFGGSATAPGGRSIRAHAEAALAAVPCPRFHVAAWSMGGGVALHMAELAPGRVHSLTQIAAIGVQEAEGSGSFAFEHLKYALMWALLVPGAELLPHFGLLGTRTERSSFCRNFWESDQRPLRGILASTRTPMFVAHGRHDFLVPSWCAEESFRLAASSRLVIFPGSHFLLFPPPFGQLDELAPELDAFLARHDAAGVPEPHERRELSAAEPSSLPEPDWLPRKLPWWIAFAALVAGARWRPGTCGLLAGGLAALLQLDTGLALCAALAGCSWRALAQRPRSWKRWALALARFVTGLAVASTFTVWAAPGLCARAGVIGGTLLALALPIAAAELLTLGWRRRRAARLR